MKATEATEVTKAIAACSTAEKRYMGKKDTAGKIYFKDTSKEGIREGGQRERILMIRQMLKEGMEKSLIIRIARCSDEELAIAAGQ